MCQKKKKDDKERASQRVIGRVSQDREGLQKMLTAATEADKHRRSVLPDADVPGYSADGSASSDHKAKPKLVWETNKLISIHEILLRFNGSPHVNCLNNWLLLQLRVAVWKQKVPAQSTV